MNWVKKNLLDAKFQKQLLFDIFLKNCFCSRTIEDVSDPSRKIMIQFFVNSSKFFDIFLSQKVKGGKQKFFRRHAHGTKIGTLE